jgi:hypothetical protein
VVDAGAKGVTISRDGAVVWTGQRSSIGAYHTHTSTLPSRKLEGLLRLVAVGDERTPKVHVAEHRHEAAAPAKQTATPAATESKRPISAAQAEALAHGREVRAEQLASQRAGAPPAASAKPKRRRGRRPATSAPPTAASARKSTAKPKAKPVQTRRATSATHPAAAKSAAPPKPKPGRPRKHPAPAATAAPSKKAERAPATRRSVRNPAVDDTAVLAEVKKKLKHDDPKNAAALYGLLRRIWFAGGREATLAWMASQNIASVVEAFRDWVEKNPETANALLQESPQAGRSAAA